VRWYLWWDSRPGSGLRSPQCQLLCNTAELVSFLAHTNNRSGFTMYGWVGICEVHSVGPLLRDSWEWCPTYIIPGMEMVQQNKCNGPEFGT
jgi:hypothetical protein